MLMGMGAYRRDAFPDLTFEAQIGLTQLSTFLTQLGNICALCKQQKRCQWNHVAVDEA